MDGRLQPILTGYAFGCTSCGEWVEHSSYFTAGSELKEKGGEVPSVLFQGKPPVTRGLHMECFFPATALWGQSVNIWVCEGYFRSTLWHV